MKRFNFEEFDIDMPCDIDLGELVEDSEGDYVLFDDIKPLIKFVESLTTDKDDFTRNDAINVLAALNKES